LFMESLRAIMERFMLTVSRKKGPSLESISDHA
jgi:hypothetical protein